MPRNITVDTNRRRFLQQAALAGAAVCAPLLFAPPADAGGLVSMPSVADQKKLGQQAAQQTLKKYKEVFDARATHFNMIGQRLVSNLPAADRNVWDYNFHVLDSKEVNAFALPGGPMFMFTGLYEKLTTDDALAGVTGHEMTHVRKQHWAKAAQKEQERQLALTGLLLLFRGGGKYGQALAGTYDQLTGLKYSRGEEDQADAGGLDNMVAAGFNPQGMIQLFQVLNSLSGSGSTPAFLSDHPLTNDRIKAAQQRITALGQNRLFPSLTPLNYTALR